MPVVQVDDLRDPADMSRWQDREAGDLAGRIGMAVGEAGKNYGRRVGLGSGLLIGITSIAGGALGLPPWTSLPLAILAGLVMGEVFKRDFHKRADPAVRKTALLRRRCAACGYALRGCVVQGDGCVICPECEAAWAVEKMGVVGLSMGETVPAPPAVPDDVSVPDTTGMTGNWWKWTRYVTDDQGQAVPVVDYRLRAPLERESDAGMRARLSAAREAMKPDASRLTLRLLVVLVVGAILAWQLHVAGRDFGSVLATQPGTMTWARAGDLVGPLLRLLVCGGIIVLGLLALRGFGFGPRATEVRLSMVKQGLCPSCAADLWTRWAKDSGFVKCGKCGSAWSIAPPRDVMQGVNGNRS